METKTVIDWGNFLPYVVVVTFFMVVVTELSIDNRWYRGAVTILGCYAARILCPAATTKRVPVY